MRKGYLTIVCTLFLFLATDIFFFRILIWQLPNESAWSAMPHYNYIYKLKHTRPAQRNEKLVLIVGSSVALYSVLEDQLEQILNSGLEKGASKKYRVRMLAHQGMTPFHLNIYLDDLLALKPAIVIYATHPVDLRLEKPWVHQNMDAFLQRNDSPDKQQAVKMYAHSILNEGEFRSLAPLKTLFEYSDFLEKNEKYDYGLAAILGSYRYQSIALPAYRQMLDNHFSNARHYQNYAGIPVQTITHRGWVGKKFSFKITRAMLKQPWVINAPAGLFEKNKIVTLKISSCKSRLDCQKFLFKLKPGWQHIQFPKNFQVGDRLDGEVDATFYDEHSDDLLTLRFVRNFGLDAIAKRTREIRPLRREDEIYSSFTDQQYIKSFNARLLRFDQAGFGYLKAIKEAREYMANREFNESLYVFRLQRKIFESLTKEKRKILLINTPENPLSRSWYGNRKWYKGYVEFLKGFQSRQFQFLDYHDHFPMQNFYDYHHLSYYGALKMTRALSVEIGQLESVKTE